MIRRKGATCFEMLFPCMAYGITVRSINTFVCIIDDISLA